jgi:surface polysaccharide O-acyltransferase-like enzyme
MAERLEQKDPSIETLRGVAILLVLSGYIVRHDIIPMDLSHPSVTVTLLKYLEHTLSTIRMPLFTVISGYLYAASPAVPGSLKKLVTGKFRRIMIPFLTLTAIQFLVFSLFPESGYHLSELYKAYIWPDQQLWFLLAVFIILVITGCLDSLKALSTPKRFLTVCLIAAVLHASVRLPGAFSAYGVNYLFPFFLLGYGLKRYALYFMQPRYFPLLGFIFVISVSIQPFYHAATQITGDPPFHLRRLVDLAVPFSCFPILFYYRRPVPVLAFFGACSFGIYLFHRISVSLVRAGYEAFNVQDPLQIFTGYLAGGILLALLFQKLCEQSDLTSRLVLGLKAKPGKAAKQPVLLGRNPAPFTQARKLKAG